MDTEVHRPNGTTGKRLTRKRVPLSCVACRIRKLKCNREKPCQNCIVRGDTTAASCTYAEKVEGKLAARSNPRSDAEDMRKRIKRLEQSVLSIMSSDKTNMILPEKPLKHVMPESIPDEGEDSGQLGQNISVDSRSTHWDAILNELGAMKEAWSEENDQIELSMGISNSSPRLFRPSFLAGLSPLPDRATVFASLPPKDDADKLIARFFQFYNPAMPAKYIVHRETFLKQYENHWVDPNKSKLTWVSLLFGIMCHILQDLRRSKEELPGFTTEITDLYRIRAAQCIVMADITKTTKYMVEAMLIYTMIEYGDERDGDPGSWFLSGAVVRIALQQGYHRDPSQYPNISVFDGEMRRRLWTLISQFELLCCVKMGLPKTVRFQECDTAPASNLYEEELHEDMKTLPPSRPLAEDTPMSYFVTKYNIMRAYGFVVEFLHLVEPQPYEDVMRLDRMLSETRELVPSYLRVRPLEEMMDDPPSRLAERYLLQLFYCKAICILHRKHWKVKANVAPDSCSFYYSRKTCVSAAMILLDQQASMHRACQPGGLLASIKWYHFAINCHDFLLAAMIVCLDMFIGTSSPENQPNWIIPDVEKFDLIKRARAIWADIISDCKDARRAFNILDRIIPKLTIKVEETKKTFENRLGYPISASASNPDADMLHNPYFTDQYRPGIPLIADPMGKEDAFMQDIFLSSGGILDSLGTDFNLPADFDWDTWDQLVNAQSLGQELPFGQAMPIAP